jgi:benzoate membrane transport protein
MAVRVGTMAAALATAYMGEHARDAALVTGLVTLSGLTVAGIGSAFGGVAAGTVALLVQQYRLR